MRIIKFFVGVLAGITTLGSFLLLLGLVFYPEGPVIWIGIKGVIYLLVIVTGIFTIGSLFNLSLGHTRAILYLGGIFLVIMGSAGSVWTYHLGQVTGDLEVWVGFVCLLLIAQGAVVLWDISNNHSPVLFERKSKR